MPLATDIMGPGERNFHGRVKFASVVLWLLTLAFLSRVLGQLIQSWSPHPALPAFAAFQGSGLPYWLLLSSQLLILFLMAHHAWLAFSGKLVPRPETGRRLLWLGSIYMAGSVARILIGVAFDNAPGWFHAWIPAGFHVVLASYVLVLASCHRRTLSPTRSAAS